MHCSFDRLHIGILHNNFMIERYFQLFSNVTIVKYAQYTQIFDESCVLTNISYIKARFNMVCLTINHRRLFN